MINSLLKQFKLMLIFITVRSLTNGKKVLPLAMIQWKEKSKSYLSGGLLGYYFCHNQNCKMNLISMLRILYVRRLSYSCASLDAKPSDISKPEFAKLLESTSGDYDFKEVKLLSLLPANWPRELEGKGFPHAWHLAESAKTSRVEFFDYPTNFISGNPNVNNIDDITKEWREINEFIDKIQPNLIILSGHKRSFSNKNINGLMRLRRNHPGVKVCLLLLDDWSLEYQAMIESWDNFVDYILVYEFESVLFNNVILKNAKFLIWPFPRKSVKPNSVTPVSKLSFNFYGSIYLNRLPWLLLLKSYLKKSKIDLDLIIDTGSLNAIHKLDIEQYLNKYVGSNKVFLHFLERTPNVYTFTSSVWDSFSHQSLVVVQTNFNNDPVQNFFKPGVHYLRFRCSHELIVLVDWINRNRLQAQEIAIAGNAYFKKNYNSNKLFSYLFQNILDC